MLKALLLFSAVVLGSAAFARDSTWLLCNSDSLAMSLHEHRGKSGDDRETTLTLIFGVHELRGILKGADSGPVTLRETRATETNFVGKISVDYEANELSLAGTLKLDGEPFNIDAKLECKEMSTDL